MPRNWQKGLAVMNANKKGKFLGKANPREVLARYLSDESTSSIAASIGVTRQALSNWLIRTAETQWKEVQVARAIARKESAEDDMEKEGTVLDLARARERLKAAQWELERLCRRIYGTDTLPANYERPIQINIGISREPLALKE